jgi:hypothetical protein
VAIVPVGRCQSCSQFSRHTCQTQGCKEAKRCLIGQ